MDESKNESRGSLAQGRGDVDRKQSPLSIAICAFNGLEYTKLLVHSLRKHSRYGHEVLIYSDGSKDGTLEWLRGQKDIRWQHDHRNLGICTAMNRVAKMATRDYLFFPNTDHVLSPGWDEALLKHLGRRTVVSCQCIEPGIVPVASIFHARNCGTRWDEFDEARFHAAVREVSKPRQVSGVNYPFVLSKSLWNEVGGLDERFNPGPANDPDLFYRMTFAGAKMVRAEDVVIYHFSGKSSRLADEAKTEHVEWHLVTERNEERFLEKWGERYRYANGGLPNPGPEAESRWKALKGELPQVEVRSRMSVVLDGRSVGSRMDGISLYTSNLLRALARLKQAPKVHCLSNDPVTLEKLLGLHQNVTFTPCDVAPGDLRRESECIPLEIRKAGAELFHGPAFAIPPGMPVPSVVTIHDLAFVLHPEWYPPHFVRHLTQVCEESITLAAGVIVNSDHTKRDLVARYPNAAAKTRRVYEALPVELGAPVEQSFAEGIKTKYGKDASFILSVGVQQRRKNAVGLLRAFARMRQTTKLAQKLVLVGGSECEDPDLSGTILSLNLESEVILTGHLPKAALAVLYQTAALFVYPSLYEGFGFPPLEAMAAGVPVVCSDRASLPEVVGRAARLVDPSNTDLLASAMAEILLDRELREDLVRRGRERVGEFSWDKVAEETFALYEECLRPIWRLTETRGESTTLLVGKASSVRPSNPASRSDRITRVAAAGTPSLQVQRMSPVRHRKSRPRIAIDARLVGAGSMGTGKYTRELLSALFSKDREAEYVLIGPEGSGLEALIGAAPVIQQVAAGPETLLNPSWEQFSLPSHLLGCDLYFSPTGIVPVARPCKAVCVVHDLGFLDHPGHYEAALREHLSCWVRNSCRSSDRLVAVSEFTRSRVVHHYQVPGKYIDVVHHGRPSNRSSRTKSRLKGRHEEYVLCVSSFEPNKNLSALIAAFVQVASGWPGRLVLAGRRGRDLDALRNIASESALSHRIEFVVDADDRRIEGLYDGASLFVFPSLYEGFGLPLLEAMAVGVPVITSRKASCPEVAGEGALLVDDPSPDHLARAMKEVLGDDSMKIALGRAAYERAKQFSWDKAADEVWDSLEACLEDR